MHFATLIGSITALAAFASAAAIPDTSARQDTPKKLFKRSNECGDSEFHNETSGGSPFYYDCLFLRNNIAGDGTWFLAANEEKDLASWGSCKFRVKSYDNLGGRVGNEDIRDLIMDAINRFNRDNRIGARGRMSCNNILGSPGATVNWWIQNTSI